MHLKMSSGKWRPFYFGLHMLSLNMIPWGIWNVRCGCQEARATFHELSELHHDNDIGDESSCNLKEKPCRKPLLFHVFAELITWICPCVNSVDTYFFTNAIAGKTLTLTRNIYAYMCAYLSKQLSDCICNVWLKLKVCESQVCNITVRTDVLLIIKSPRKLIPALLCIAFCRNKRSWKQVPVGVTITTTKCTDIRWYKQSLWLWRRY